MDESSLQVERQVFDVVRGALDELVKSGKTGNARIAPAIPELIRLVDGQVENGRRECLHAGLWILADELDRAHTICQEIPNKFGSAWHAVVHRRDGDFWNSKFWWRRSSGIKWEGLAQRIQSELGAGPPKALSCVRGEVYDPERFVELVEAHHEGPAPKMCAALITIQRLEWMSLFSQVLRGE